MKTKNPLKSAVAFTVVLSTMFTACKKEEVTTPTPSEPPFVSSIKVGDESLFDLVGNFGAGNTKYTNGVSMKFITDLGNNNFYYNIKIPMFGVNDTMTIHDDKNGVYEKLNNGTLKLLAGVVPPKKGDLSYTVIGNDTTYQEVLDINVSITVPFGNVSCVKIKEYYSNKIDYIIEHTDNKGLVKMEQFGIYPVTFELRSRNY